MVGAPVHRIVDIDVAIAGSHLGAGAALDLYIATTQIAAQCSSRYVGIGTANIEVHRVYQPATAFSVCRQGPYLGAVQHLDMRRTGFYGTAITRLRGRRVQRTGQAHLALSHIAHQLDAAPARGTGHIKQARIQNAAALQHNLAALHGQTSRLDDPAVVHYAMERALYLAGSQGDGRSASNAAGVFYAGLQSSVHYPRTNQAVAAQV